MTSTNRISFHHFGLAVKEFNKASRFYLSLGYTIGASVVDPLQEVEVVLCTHPTFPAVEFIRPISDASPVNNYLKNQPESIYHICLEVDDFDVTIRTLYGAERVICVSPPKPAVLFGGRNVAFYYAPGIGLVELLRS